LLRFRSTLQDATSEHRNPPFDNACICNVLRCARIGAAVSVTTI
jgi:hypothetical protein